MKNVMELVPNVRKAWFAKWFDSSFYQQLYAYRDEDEAASFIDALIELLDPEDSSSILDLGCGGGRHSKYLASKGFQVTGLDLAASSIRKAKKTAAPGVQFYEHDMRVPFGFSRFNYVFNFFTSFGYFKTNEENQQVIENMFRALKAGGKVVIDYLNVKYSEGKIIPKEEKEIDGIRYFISRWSDESRFYKKIEVDDQQAGGNYEFVEEVSKLNVKDFERLFRKAGLKLMAVYGDYELNRYHEIKSPRLILIGEK